MSDVEVGSNISCDPGIVYPEKLDIPAGLDYGCRGVRGENIDPTVTVVRIHIRVRGRDIVIGNNPLPRASLYH